MAKKERRILRVRYGFLVPPSKDHTRGRTVKGGDLVGSDDPIVEGREELFEEVGEVVERATANPGEVRVPGRRQARKPAAAQAQEPTAAEGKGDAGDGGEG